MIAAGADIQRRPAAHELGRIEHPALCRGESGIGPITGEHTRGRGPYPALFPPFGGDDALQEIECPIGTVTRERGPRLVGIVAVDGGKHVLDRPLLERSCMEDGGEERPCSFAPVRRFASIGCPGARPEPWTRRRGPLRPRCLRERVATSQPVLLLADKAPSRSGRRAVQGRHGTGPPRSRQGRRPWWRLRSPGRKPRERSEPRRRPSFPNVVAPTRARRPAGGRTQGRFEPRARTLDRCHGRRAAMWRAARARGSTGGPVISES